MNSDSAMRFKPALTKKDSIAIQESNPQSADVRALLWEVNSLRALALYVDQLQRILGAFSVAQGDVLEAIRV